MKHLFALLAIAMLATGCPGQPGDENTATTGTSQAPKAPPFTVTLVCTDLGIGDGSFVREADEALRIQAMDGRIDYLVAGELPTPLINQADSADIGMPVAGSDQPGTMTMTAACELINAVEQTDWLVLSTPAILPHALARISAGKLAAELVLVLDNDRLGEWPVETAVPVYIIEYDTRPVAFLCGVAAAASSNSGQFVIMAAESDPQAHDFLDAAWTGTKYQTNGAVAAVTTVPVNETTGLVTPEDYHSSLSAVKTRMGGAFVPNHYILALGRTTPAILNAVAKKPINGYVTAGYADYTQVRTARVVGCGIKHPAAALGHIFENLDPGNRFTALADEAGLIKVGLTEGAVGFTDLRLYSRFNPDGDDIEEQVRAVLAEIITGELDVLKLIERFNRDQE